MGCIKLRAVRFPENLQYIGGSCFSGAGLESVNFPASLRTICQSSFSLCASLRNVKFADGLEVLGVDEYPTSGSPRYYGVFSKSALEEVKLPSTLKRIEYDAFQRCEMLKTIRLPGELEYIGKWCFEESGLEELVIPGSVKEVGCRAFFQCAKLKHVQLSDGLEILGRKQAVSENEYEGQVFAGSSIESIAIPSTLKVIEACTFFNCGCLNTVKFSEGLEKICASAFA